MSPPFPQLAGLDHLDHPHLRSLSFPPEEYRARVARVQAAMAGLGLDALLCTAAGNVCYLTGFESVLWYKFILCLILPEGPPVLLAQDFEMPNACATVWCEDWVTYPCFGDPIAAAQQLLRERGLLRGRLGLEYTRWSMAIPTYLKLKDALATAILIDATSVLDRVMRVKSPAEIAVMRRCGELTGRGMTAALAAVRNGTSDNEVARAAYAELIGGGSESMSIVPIVTVGARSSIPHSTHRRVPIGPGDSILIEVGACLYRYSTASMRAAAIEPVPELPRQMFEGCRASVDEVVRHIRPGAVGDDVARRADTVIGTFSSRYVWHGIYGYSLGLGFPPDWNDTSALIMRGSELILEPGMIFHVSTSLRKVGVCGVAFSETVLVTPEGAEILTHASRELTIPLMR